MLAAALRTIQLVLLAMATYLGYLTVAPVLRAAPLPEVRVGELAPRPQAQRELRHFAVIAERNLFKSHGAGAALALAREERLEEASLNLTLLGTTIAVPAERSSAVLEDGTRGETVVVYPNQRVAGATVERIEPRRVVLSYNGRLQQISFEDAENSRRTNPRSSVRRESRARNPRTATARARAASRSSRSGASELLSRTRTLSALLDNPEFELGDGERIMSVNGIEVTDRSRIEELVESLTGPGTKSVVIGARDGSERTVTVELP